MKRVFSILAAFAMVLGLTVSAQATLLDLGDGTVLQTRSDGSSLMWDQNASGYLGNFSGANAYISPDA